MKPFTTLVVAMVLFGLCLIEKESKKNAIEQKKGQMGLSDISSDREIAVKLPLQDFASTDSTGIYGNLNPADRPLFNFVSGLVIEEN